MWLWSVYPALQLCSGSPEWSFLKIVFSLSENVLIKISICKIKLQSLQLEPWWLKYGQDYSEYKGSLILN